jgi:hypothetical protein
MIPYNKNQPSRKPNFKRQNERICSIEDIIQYQQTRIERLERSAPSRKILQRLQTLEDAVSYLMKQPDKIGEKDPW